MNKKVFFTHLFVLLTVVFYSCESNHIQQKEKKERVFIEKLGRFDNKFKVVIIDSCEYLYTDEGSNAQTVFHKGNCKFCINRNKK